ncbi:MAG: hypothetical protein IJ508_06025, partial [Oscillospiraceae bacterium]|nr:hypothetical protein [Oscillospiraceae bacterium]
QNDEQDDDEFSQTKTAKHKQFSFFRRKTTGIYILNYTHPPPGRQAHKRNPRKFAGISVFLQCMYHIFKNNKSLSALGIIQLIQFFQNIIAFCFISHRQIILQHIICRSPQNIPLLNKDCQNLKKTGSASGGGPSNFFKVRNKKGDAPFWPTGRPKKKKY